MVSENEFKRNRNTVFLASLILDDFYSGYFLHKDSNYGGPVFDAVNQKNVYQIDLTQFKNKNPKSKLEQVLECVGNPYYNPYDFNEINVSLLKDILKASINFENVVIKNGILSII